MHGSLGTGATIYRNCARVGEVYFIALRQEFVKQKVWVSTDEWMDTQGHAIMNVIIGRGKAAYVCESKTLDSKGPTDGVEHKEVAKVVTDCLQKMGIESNDVLLFICDAAAVLLRRIGMSLNLCILYYELHAEMQRKTHSGLYQARVEEAIVQAKFPNIVRDRFKAAYKAGLAKLQDYISNPARAMSFYKRLRGFDPRNIRDMDAPWASVSDLLGAAPSPDDDDDLQDRKQKLNALLASEWHRYTQLERHAVLNHHDNDTFWQAHASLIYDVVAPYIWFPTSAAFVECSFSLAGLIDAKNRQKMNPSFRAVAVAMFCNGDVEQRFVKK